MIQRLYSATVPRRRGHIDFFSQRNSTIKLFTLYFVKSRHKLFKHLPLPRFLQEYHPGFPIDGSDEPIQANRIKATFGRLDPSAVPT
jgi:hypothetical protein